MGIYSRCTALSAAVGILALAAAPRLWAQQPGQTRPDTGAVQTDTSGYKGYQPSDTTRAGPSDTSEMNQGAPRDTALKAKPGVQTGPSAKDSGAANQAGMQAPVDSVVCKDGSRAAEPGKTNCAQHGGVDKAATKAARTARGYESKPSDKNNAAADTSQPRADTALKAKPGVQTGPSADTGKANADTGKVNKDGASGYKYNGPSTDTALKAKPGVQTGPKDSSRAGGMSDSSQAGGMSDSSSGQTQR
jgi:hypothetical protein